MAAPRVLVPRTGNVLWADDGFGVRCLEHLADAAIRRDACEAGRPTEDEACRTGDARFIPAEGA